MAINMHIEGVDVGDASDQRASEVAQVTNNSEKNAASQQSYASAGPSNMLTNTPKVDEVAEGKLSIIQIMIPVDS